MGRLLETKMNKVYFEIKRTPWLDAVIVVIDGRGLLSSLYLA